MDSWEKTFFEVEAPAWRKFGRATKHCRHDCVFGEGGYKPESFLIRFEEQRDMDCTGCDRMAKVIREAEGYALERINRAKGDAFRFDAIWEEYKNAIDVTRRRLYLETMKTLLPKVEEKVILDTDVKGIVPLLQLSEKRKGGEQS